MKFRLTAVIVLALCLSNAFADEGMWLLGNLKKNKQTDRVMRELGLQMPVNKLYNPKKPCLADAVVSFGGFCSGVVVSEDGLVFTNHHCGFSSIQQHSSVEHDYLKDGFVARSLEEELPNPELYVRFPASYGKCDQAGIVCRQTRQDGIRAAGGSRFCDECNRDGSIGKGLHVDGYC